MTVNMLFVSKQIALTQTNNSFYTCTHNRIHTLKLQSGCFHSNKYFGIELCSINKASEPSGWHTHINAWIKNMNTHTFLITTALTQTQTAHLSLCVLGRCDRLIWILLAEKCAWPKTEPVLWNIALNIAGILSNDMWIVCSFIWILIPFRCACGGWRQYVLGCASLLYFHFICTLIFQKGREGIFFFNKTSNIHFNLSVRSIRILWFICLYTINHIVEIHCVISEASFGTLSCRPYCKF